MVCEGVEGDGLVRHGAVPDIEEVVVATGGEVPSIRGPAKATHLLTVIGQRPHVVLCHTDVMVMDGTGPRSTAQHNSTLNEMNSKHGFLDIPNPVSP